MPPFPLNDPGSSFHHLLASRQPDSLPSFMAMEMPKAPADFPVRVPHGTTVLALLYQEGVVIAGDRRATEGYAVSERRIEKVRKTDATSAIAIAGAAGPCLELTRLFQVELEHYEKIEGTSLSLEGKANKLAQMIKANLPMAMQGLVVLPIFAGYDVGRRRGRIFKYDVAGGRYEESAYHAIGSGGRDARATLKKLYKTDLSKEEAVRAALEAIYDAAEADTATGGPDMIREIYPMVKAINKAGVADVPDDEVKGACEAIIARERGV